MSSVRRFHVINQHLNSKFPKIATDTSLDELRSKAPKINSVLLAKHYFDDLFEPTLVFRKLMTESDLFNHEEYFSLSVEEARTRVLEQIQYIFNHFTMSYELDRKYPLYKLNPIYAMAEYDLSLSTRMIVHHILYIDTLQNLGTVKHRQLIDDAYSFQSYGAFAMTEMGHGSNVAAVETIATYDPLTKGFIINSPTATSAKWWIGALANTADSAAIFAQLIVDGHNKGVHAFVVPIRDRITHESFPGVTIGDCGKKIALDGIDNGFVLFNNYKVSYDCLLDNHSQIKDDKFKSPIKNKEKRLGIMMGGLIRGRFCVINGSEINIRNSVTVALRYAAIRKQFGSEKETSVLNYQIQKHRLILGLAKGIAIRCGAKILFKTYQIVRPKAEANPECDELNELHSLLSALKTHSSWMAGSICQECREACGGHGISIYSSLGRFRGYQDVHMTWEGDNSVLIQQTGKYILKLLQKSFKGQKIHTITLGFLKFDPTEIKSFKTTFTTLKDLCSADLLISLLEHRVNYTLQQCMIRLQENSVTSENMVDAWNNSQVYYIQELGKAYGEYMMAFQFAEFYQKLKSECEETGSVIEKFFYLFTIERVVANLPCYLDGAVSQVQVKLMKDAVSRLCDELMGAAIVVTDALAAPDKILGSTLGASDGQAYARIVQAAENEKYCYKKPSTLHLLKKMRK